jgi:hypothetical protein
MRGFEVGEELKPVCITSSSSSHQGNECRKTLGNLTSEEGGLVDGCVCGYQWISVEGGRLVSYRRFDELPSPVTDPLMAPFWRRPTPGKTEIQHQIFASDDWPTPSPHFSIQSLCGYGYSPERYATEAAKLERYGFQCLRSRRSEDGRYWEIWYLPGDWAARGELREAIETAPKHPFTNTEAGAKKEWAAKIEVVVQFLCRNVSFGTLDVSGQRAAMVVPD